MSISAATREVQMVQRFRLGAFILSVLVILLALLPAAGTGIGHTDLLLHFGGFFCLSLFYQAGWAYRRKWAISLIGLFLALLSESLQLFLPWRSFSPYDLGADLGGLFLGLLLPRRGIEGGFWGIATFLGVGKIPWGPGTLASLLFLILYGFSSYTPRALWLLLPGVFVVGLFPAWKVAEEEGEPDPPAVVIDEVIGIMAACAWVPKAPGPLLLAFLLFRALDILKPPLIREVEKAPGGLGILLDDLLAGLAAGAIVWGILRLL